MRVAAYILAKHKIQIRVKPALRYLLGVLELKRSARRVSRIGEQRLFLLLSLLVQLLEHAPRHQYLASYLELLRIVASRQCQRNAAYGTDIGCHVVALFSVASRHGLHQFAVLVCQRN